MKPKLSVAIQVHGLESFQVRDNLVEIFEVIASDPKTPQLTEPRLEELGITFSDPLFTLDPDERVRVLKFMYANLRTTAAKVQKSKDLAKIRTRRWQKLKAQKAGVQK